MNLDGIQVTLDMGMGNATTLFVNS